MLRGPREKALPALSSTPSSAKLYQTGKLVITNKCRQSMTDGPLSIGLFTSPHLVSVRERIRMDGVPISEEVFVKYFFEVWDRLGENKAVSPIPLTHPSTYSQMVLFARQNIPTHNCVPHTSVI